MSRIHIVVASIGRPEIVRDTVARLARQTRAADGIVVASVTAADVAGLDAVAPGVEIVFSGKGLCRQRNRALDHLRGRTDVVLFLDDDFVPADTYLAELDALLSARPDIAGVTGRIIADGIKTSGIGFADAVALVQADTLPATPTVGSRQALYGCNMAIRLSAAGTLRFDEALPLYGWLEDIDFTYRLARHGPLVMSDRLAGVHMGTKGGRTSGVRTGYSQLANPIHLLRKRSAPPKLAYTMMYRNLIANLVRTCWSEPWVDRAGRLRGNLLALTDLVRGRLHPQRILELD